MKRVYLILFVALTLTMLPCRALGEEKEEEDKTWGVVGRVWFPWLNGRPWKRLDTQSKIMFLTGIEQGMFLLLREHLPILAPDSKKEMLEKEVDDLTMSGFRFGELVQQVDGFYRDSSNIRIPVVDAYKFVLKKLRGAKQAELEDYVAGLRKTYNRQPPH